MIPSSAIQRIHFAVNHSRGILSMPLCLMISDLIALITAVALGLAYKAARHGIQDWQPYVRLAPLLIVFIAVYALAGLYSSVSVSPPEEMQRATFSSVLVWITLAVATVSVRGASRSLTGTAILALGLTIILHPLFRLLARRLFAGEPWWGYPAVIFGAGPAVRRTVKTMLDQPELGLKPIAVVDDEPENYGAVYGIPVVGGFELALTVPSAYKCAYAVFPACEVDGPGVVSLLERYGMHFSRILMIPDLSHFSSLWVNPRNVGGMLGLEVCQRAFSRENFWLKRCLDLTLTLLAAAFILPLLLFIAAWIKLDSPGPALYSQQRVGRNGRSFQAWKFRSMIANADQALTRCLAEDPQMREEWERDHKLRHDPRVTRAGRFLRRTSLDELPQLWNVLTGEMSLVGPRPIVEAEIPKYGNRFDLYTKVEGGLTGMWQISGRNDVSYEERVRLDAFYVRNWSVWLDFYILLRTVEAVIVRKGAY